MSQFSFRRNSKFRRLYNTVGSSPLILFFLGGLTLLLWASASVIQIQTSEALVLGLSQVQSIDVIVFWQPIGLILGQFDMKHSTAYGYAWIIEVITLIFGLALGYAVHVLRQTNRMLGKWYTIACLVLIGLNGYADFYASPGDGVVKFLVAFAIGGMVVTGLPVGLALIEKGIEELGDEAEEDY
jgi:hypothetical protein